MEQSQLHYSDIMSEKGSIPKNNTFKSAAAATLHCLINCGIGEALGIFVAIYFGMGLVSSIILESVLAMTIGFILSLIPAMREGLSFSRAIKIVLGAEGLSIFVMGIFGILPQVLIPGLLHAHIEDIIFWAGIFISLAVGFVAAFPVNYIMIKNGKRHQHHIRNNQMK